MARGKKTAAVKTENIPETQPQTAGNTQDDAEAINLKVATEKKEEVDTVTTTTDADADVPKSKAKKQPKAKKVVVTESDEEEAKPKEKKQPKAKKVVVTESDEEEAKPKEKKRAPSAYNIFVKEAMPQLKKENEALGDNKKSQRDLMKLAAELWNKQKAEKA